MFGKNVIESMLNVMKYWMLYGLESVDKCNKVLNSKMLISIEKKNEVIYMKGEM